MIVYRVEKASRADEWPSRGALFSKGRWNERGFWIIYCSSSISLAKLETLANARSLPIHRVIMEIEIDEKAPEKKIEARNLIPDWIEVPYPQDLPRLTEEILKENRYIAMVVPSRQSPKEYNYLLYPLHPEFSRYVRVKDAYPVEFDQRLKPRNVES